MVKIIGGKRLQSYLRGMGERLSKADSVDIGFPGGATYPSGESVAAVAAMNEFGTSKAPPRPFFRSMIAEKSSEWGDATAALLRANNYDAASTLGQLGEGVAGQLRQSIASFDGAPLAPSTIKAKGSAKQLVDTGQMLGSVTHVVNSGGK